MPILRWINRHPVLSIVLMAPLLYSAVLLAYGEPLLRTFLNPFVFLPLLFFAGLSFFLRSLSLRWESLTLLRFRNNCDPEPLLRAAREIRARHNPRRRLERLTWFGWGLTEMAALCDLGQWGAAEAVLQELVPWQAKMQAMYQANYIMNHCALSLAQKRTEDAFSDLQRMDVSLQKLPLNKKEWVRWQTSLEMQHWEYRFQTQGPSEELLEMMRAQEKLADSLHTRIFCQSKLAACLLALDRREEAMPYLDFVAQNGGKLWVRLWAEDAAMNKFN